MMELTQTHLRYLLAIYDLAQTTPREVFSAQSEHRGMADPLGLIGPQICDHQLEHSSVVQFAELPGAHLPHRRDDIMLIAKIQVSAIHQQIVHGEKAVLHPGAVEIEGPCRLLLKPF